MVEERSFTRGAQREHVVQSAASAAVARLEAEFHTALFDRSRRTLELTTAGRTCRPMPGSCWPRHNGHVTKWAASSGDSAAPSLWEPCCPHQRRRWPSPTAC
ncbi:LysR family transcriptional regulator [Streptomyces sp. TM32]|nr:LysR family transcriptional regulator [Streptomyces sp. TM32]